MVTTAFALCATIVFTKDTYAHEFWIDPIDFVVAEGSRIEAELRVGEEFHGSSYSYLPDRFRLFELAQAGTRAPVESRIGDRPALNQIADKAGLVSVLHVTTDSALTYTEFEKFVRFVTHKDAVWTVEEHLARDLPTDRFIEAYSRYAKALVAVGDGAGSDQNFGMLTEFVAGANPYTDPLSDGFPVQLFYDGKPRANSQVEVFEMLPDQTVTITLHRTDADGRVVIPVESGRRYMLDAVVLREPSDELATSADAVWESLWANLTFEVPTR